MALNLVQHRAGPNVWDRTGGGTPWDSERWLAAGLAGVLVTSGIRRRSIAGLFLTLGGGALAWWAAGGVDERARRRGHLRAVWPQRQVAEDTVAEASQDSFPASDAPSWTPTTGNTGPSSTPHARQTTGEG